VPPINDTSFHIALARRLHSIAFRDVYYNSSELHLTQRFTPTTQAGGLSPSLERRASYKPSRHDLKCLLRERGGDGENLR
jgi:hypothetical protein